MADQPLKKLHTLVGSVILPQNSKGVVSPMLSAGRQLFTTMNKLAEALPAEKSDLLDVVADDLQLARTVNLITDATLQEAMGYIEQAKQDLGA